MYEEQKEFFRGLYGYKPRWLTSLQWRVLRDWYAPSNPCEPSNRQKFVEDTASKVARQARGIHSQSQAAPLVEKALDKGIQKLKERMRSPYPPVPDPETRTRFDLGQSGLLD